MSTSKHFDKICIAVVAVILVITVLFMNGASLGISATETSANVGYEDRLFDTAKVHTIDIVMEDWDSFIDTCENEEYTICTAVIDGEKYANVGIRAKGNTSLSTVSQMGSDRYSFKLEFDQYEKGKSYYGLDKLCLNNLIQDNTMMKDYLVYQMMADFGVDSPLCSYTYITVNGDDWGLYLAVEGVEDSFLERNYGSDSGNLYKPDSMSFGGGRGNGKDFNMDDMDFGDKESEEMPQPPNMQGGPGGQKPPEMPEGMEMPSFDGEMPEMPGGNMQQPGGGQMQGGPGGGMGSDDVKLKYSDDNISSYSNIFDNAKTDITAEDQTRLINSLKNLSNYEDLENTVNIDEVIRYFVVHNFVCNGDSYTGAMIHNYYLYEKDGQLSMIPWDYNLAFGTFQGNSASSSVNESIDNPVSGGNVDDRPMLGWIFSDDTFTEQYHDTFAEFIEKYFSDGQLEATIAETAELIRPYVEKDPTKFCTTEEFDAGVETLSTFVSLRSEAVSRQLNGDSTAVDTGDLNLSTMGTMGMGGGGKSMPGDNKKM